MSRRRMYESLKCPSLPFFLFLIVMASLPLWHLVISHSYVHSLNKRVKTGYKYISESSNE